MTVKELYTQKLLLKRELETALIDYDRLPIATDYRPPEQVTFSEPTPTHAPIVEPVAPSETNKPAPLVEPPPPQPQYATAQDEYNELQKSVAKQLFNADLKQLQAQGQPLLKQLDKLAKNKPLFFGKDKWQQQHDKLLDDYNRIKTAHDAIKKNGVSKYFDKARQQLEQTRPDLVQRVKDEYLAEVRADEQRRLEQYRANKATTAPKVSERELSDKARIGLQTIKNVIDAMPDGDKKTKAMAEFERTQATATNAQLEALAQVDVKVNKQTDVVIQAPSTDQDKGR